MNKIILSLALVGVMAVPSLAQAQVAQEDLQVQLETLKQQLIELLMAQIATLQAQIEQLIAEQANLRVAQVEAPVVLGSVAPALSVTYGDVVCESEYKFSIPVNISTQNGWEYGQTMKSADGITFMGGISYDMGSGIDGLVIGQSYNEPTATTSIFVRTELTNTKPQRPHYTIRNAVFSEVQELVVPNCKEL